MNWKRQIALGMLLVLITAVATYGITVNYLSGSILTGSFRWITQKDLDIIRELEPLVEVIKTVDKRYIGDVEINRLVTGAIKGAIDSLNDPYSAYFTAEEFKNFMISIQGSFEGIGISVTMDDDGLVRVISPIEDTPGHKAGILPDDKIIQINDIPVKGLTLDEAVSLMRGPKGTKVTLHIKREGIDNILTFEIIRDSIELKTVRHRIIGDDIGYIRITSFDENTSKEFKKSLNELNSKKVRGLILDLRNNPGGLLNECVKVADELIGENLIVYTEDKSGNRTSEYRSGRNKINIPLVILINKYSASASEIVAGAVQDTKSGVLVGTKTFGKGSVQEPTVFKDGSGLKLTIAKYYLPSGRSIDGIGVEPDIVVELPKGVDIFNVSEEQDTQLQKAIEVIKTD
ncbi:Carboxy-terminal processing protease CtpA [Koleobacter methoxysyntrophicus]|jgi:carboxyl-terminal processing protease|uniref:Carboxy-terminal processing protease CtpA n=1 Tax=Koleobacter methoxysyntrophicus TaxID=2751313 RepID=A0A8A0RS60_9FIRM|nr:S41 family peptidase [Koleobacter methoxysyntrophicus]QSQ10370.1 Carboxy-terminal processing protease CtpA [Koleobacter methoxysyntrophicus]